MTKQERVKLVKEGKFVLRTMKNSKGSYHVGYQTVNGGWAMYNVEWSEESKTFCEEHIRQLVKKDPTKYFNDDLIQ